MNKLLMGLTVALCLGVAGGVIAGEKAAAPAAAKKADPRMVPAALTWVTPMGPDGPAFAYVSGDAQKGPWQAFLKLKAGAAAGWHTHDSDYNAVVVQGVWNHLVQGETTPTALPVGSYWSQAKTENHDDRCEAKTGDCIVFITSSGAQTYHAKLADGKDAPTAPAKPAAPAAAKPK